MNYDALLTTFTFACQRKEPKLSKKATLLIPCKTEFWSQDGKELLVESIAHAMPEVDQYFVFNKKLYQVAYVFHSLDEPVIFVRLNEVSDPSSEPAAITAMRAMTGTLA